MAGTVVSICFVLAVFRVYFEVVVGLGGFAHAFAHFFFCLHVRVCYVGLDLFELCRGLSLHSVQPSVVQLQSLLIVVRRAVTQKLGSLVPLKILGFDES